MVGKYDEAMRSLPVPNSGVVINRIEVYVVNTQANTQDVRNVVAFTDLGEHPDFISSNLPLGNLTDNGSIFGGAVLEPATDVVPSRAPSNYNNDLFRSLTLNEGVMDFTGANEAISGAIGGSLKQGVHYERVGTARRLTASEFTYNSRLGFISLRQSLNNAEVLAVAKQKHRLRQTGAFGQELHSQPAA